MPAPAAGGAWAAAVDGDGRLLGAVAPGDDRISPAVTVGAGASLKDVTSALLLSESGWVAVVEGDRLLGVLTPESVYAAARRAAPPAQ